ncbi:MAG TPA: hypothetical protein VJ302_02545 [Blastocatellia bacterium]|nr:hypothetical protein [Blastocatellia bacterium]
MHHLDEFLIAFQRWIRSKALLYRLTLGTRLLLAVGFIPTGMVKLLGRRFSSPETQIGAFFEFLYHSGLYYRFLGLTQVLAGVLVLSSATATLGALIFFGIMLNIFVITVSYNFNYTPVITGPMLLATLYLLLWDYHRLRSIFGLGREQEGLLAFPPEHQLSGAIERSAYVVGLVSGLGLFSVLRSLFFPYALQLWFLLGCLISFLVALWYGLVRRR